MKKLSILSKAISLMFLVGVFLSSCTQKEENRYIVLSTGDKPIFLDTKTKEIYAIFFVVGSDILIYKKALSQVEK